MDRLVMPAHLFPREIDAHPGGSGIATLFGQDYREVQHSLNN